MLPEVEHQRKTTTPKWEREFWHYISSGDGNACPIYQKCEARLKGYKCACPVMIDENKAPDGLIGSICSPELMHTLSINSRGAYCSQNVGFVEGIRPGRIFELLEMLSESWLKAGKVRHPPVPSDLVYLFDTDYNIEIRTVPLKAYGGAIWKIDDSWLIYLNANDTPVKQRFNLFHEAFHILAHCRATPVFRHRGRNEGGFNEILADNFALHILMPKKFIDKLWEKSNDPKQMAEQFMVPESTVLYRLQSLHLI